MARLQFLFKESYHSELDMNSFDDRVKLQKLIFLLRSEGIEFDYHFNWYIRGPYSPRLAEDGFSLEKHLRRSNLHYEATKKELDVLKKIKKAHHLIDDSNSAELVASYLFLEPHYKDKTAEELNLRKPRFDMQQIKKTMTSWKQLTR